MKAPRTLHLLAVLCVGMSLSALAQQPGAPPAPSSQSDSLVSNPGPDVSGNPLDGMGVKKYLLGPGDVLDLRVFNEPQFSDKLQVSDEGNVEVPFVGAIPARCRTDVEVRKDITAALSKYLKSPQVSLRITEARSRPPAVVFGAVRDAQRVEMRRRVRLLDLLALTGGVTEEAGSDIQIFHTEAVMCPEREEELMVAEKKTADDVLGGAFTVYKLADLKVGAPEANPFIRPGDVVIVTKAQPVYITGAVRSPQGVFLRDKLQLTTAIAMVGGLQKGAKSSEVLIYRMDPKTRERKLVKVDFDAIRKQKTDDVFLEPYDVIDVPEKSGLKTDILGFIRGGAMSAATQAITGIPLRVIY
ncbi:MAG: polysaccharide biosynthesis/export family protein [Pyrinomonadaceae bacterium]